jgi:hypothetical protein
MGRQREQGSRHPRPCALLWIAIRIGRQVMKALSGIVGDLRTARAKTRENGQRDF